MDYPKVKRDIPVTGNVSISYGITRNVDGSSRGKESHWFFTADQNQWAWRVSLMLEDQHWCIPMVFAGKRDATIAAQSIAPYFSDCKTREEGRDVVETRGHAWLKARLTENLRW